MRAVLVGLLLLSTAAHAAEGARREEVPAEAHQPVLTRAPELLGFVEAEYPPAAAAAGKTASVRMAVTLDETGLVSGVEVLEPVGDGFDEAATEAVRRFRFSPAEVDGVPAPVQLEYVYNFVLEEPPAPAQEERPRATLQGRLLARGSRSAVEGGTVRCGDSAQAAEAMSDAEGRFSLEVPAGTCEVRVLAQGFRLFRAEEQLEAGQTTEIEFFLLPEAVGFETVVRGRRDKAEVVRRTLTRAEMTKIPGTFGDPIRVVQNLPGVARSPLISGFLIVRGASPNQTLTFLDGVEIPNLFHIGGGPSVFSPEFLDQIDFYPGGFGARYGRAIGGIVEATTRKGAADTLHGSVDVDLLDAGFFLEAPLAPGISIAAAARRSYIDVLLPWALETFVPQDPEAGTLSVLPVYYDYQLRLDVGGKRGEPSPSTGSLMAFGSDDALTVAATGAGRSQDVSVDFHTVFHRLKGDWTFRSGALTSVFAPYVGYDLADIDFGAASFRADVFSAGGRQLLELAARPWLTLRAGADVVFEHGSGVTELPVAALEYVPFPGDNPRVELQRIETVVNAFDGALFVEADLKLGPLQVAPGLRGTYVRKRGVERTSLDPRLYARWQFAEPTALKGSLGLYTQAPDGTAFLDAPFGNPAIDFERAFQASLGVEHRFTDAVNLDVTGFYNRRFDVLVRPGLVREVDGSVIREAISNNGLGRAYGLEVMLRHEVTREFFGWVAYTLSRSEFRLRGEEGYAPTTFDQTHILTAVGSYRLPFWDLELGGRFRFATGRPTLGLIGGADVFQADGNRYFGTFTDPLARRFRAFQQLDVRLDKSFVFDRWTLNVYLDVQNIYNAQNVEAVFYDYRFRQDYEVAGLPILPVLGVKGSF